VVATQVHVQPPNPKAVTQFVAGYHDALYVGACITFAAAWIAALMVREASGERSSERVAATERAGEPAVGA